jgi:CO/xanthine dehydrogenase FAD-binding subunit
MRAAVSEYELRAPRTLSDALDLLSQSENWRPIAGGTDLMVLFNAGKLPFRRLVSIQDLAELRDIEILDATVIVGAAVTYSEIRSHPVLQSEFPLLCQAASWTGGTATQNRGTLGGNIANASPAADSAPMLLVYDAEIELTSTRGVRWLPYTNFHIAYKTVQMEPNELITRIRLRRPARNLLQYARKIGTRKAQAISKVCFASACECDNGALHNVRIAVGSVAPTPLRCFQTENILEDRLLTAHVIAEAKQVLCREIRPITDIRSSSRYRSQVTMNLLGEFLGAIL